MAAHVRPFVVALVFAGAALAAPATPEQVKQAVENLGSPRFAVREAASKFLENAGRAAEADLRVAATSKDEETANRAKAILEKFDWGLYPDTPADVVKLIERFRGGDPQTRQQVVGELIHQRPTRFDLLRKLVAHEREPEARTAMYDQMAGQAREAIPGLIVAGNLDEADQLLEICLSPTRPHTMSDFATFQYLRGRVPQAIARMEALKKHGSDDAARATEALVYLYRVKQDWAAARAAADASNNPDLRSDLAWEANDWKRLAEAPDKETDPEDGGAKAAYYRLAGDKAKYDELIAKMRKDLMGVEGDDSKAYELAYALLLNGQGADAIEVLKGRSRHGADLVFDLLCAQLKFKEAFAYYDGAMKEIADDPQAEYERHHLTVRRAAVLANLGDRDGATQVFRSVLEKATGQVLGDRLAVDLVKTAARVGMRDLAADLAARCMTKYGREGRWDMDFEVIEPIFEQKAHLVWTWWEAERQADPEADAGVVMARVLEFVDGKADRAKADRLAGRIEKLRTAPKGSSKPGDALQFGMPADRGDFAIAEAYRSAGVADKAEEFYKKAIRKPGEKTEIPPVQLGLDDLLGGEEGGIVSPQYRYLLAYADFLSERKRPKEAAALYRKAWEAAPSQPLPLFLAGNALKQAGDAAGAKLMEQAHWVPLGTETQGNEVLRAKFSEDLAKRGFDADSRKEMELILATGWFRSYAVGNVHLRMARIKARQGDNATAAKMYETDVVSLFRTGGGFVDAKAYLTVPELARTYRAKALFAAGKVDEALAEAKAGLTVLPANIELALGLVPDLDKAGKKKEADDLYRQVKTAYEAALKDYGSSADLRNSLAWTMVNCNRDLDEALKHAEKAVEVSPKAAGYIDTLAEIHFRKKDRAKALELMKQCARLEPENPYYRKQLERFEKKPFDSPLPDEETGDE